MYHNIHAGRLRDLVELYEPDIESDKYGQTSGKTLVFDGYAEVKTVAGNKVQIYGSIATSTIITVLMWYDERASSKQLLVHDGIVFEVNHVNPDEIRKGMILTCEVVRK